MGQRKVKKPADEQRVIQDFTSIVIGEMSASPLLARYVGKSVRSLAEYLKSLAQIEDIRVRALAGDDIPF